MHSLKGRDEEFRIKNLPAENSPSSRQQPTLPHHHTREWSFEIHLYTVAEAAMTRFRPCIDLHAGQVKQIVGGTLTTTSSDLQTNHVSNQPASHFAQLYRDNALAGAHVIMLGPGNEEAAKQALSAWPHSLQLGGGITDKNARQWLDRGAYKVRPGELAVCGL